MSASSITITVGSETIVMNELVSDNYASEHMARTATGIYRMRIRHSKEKQSASSSQLDRHNAELSFEEFPSVTYPNGRLTQVYVVIRNPIDALAADVDKLADGLSDWVKANNTALVNWISVF